MYHRKYGDIYDTQIILCSYLREDPLIQVARPRLVQLPPHIVKLLPHIVQLPRLGIIYAATSHCTAAIAVTTYSHHLTLYSCQGCCSPYTASTSPCTVSTFCSCHLIFCNCQCCCSPYTAATPPCVAETSHCTPEQAAANHI